MSLHRPISLVAILAAVGLAGCGSTNPLDRKVAAPDPNSFQLWLGNADGDWPPADLARFQAAEREIKLNVMADGATGEDAVEQGFCERIDGKSVRAVIALGLRDRIDRLRSDLADARRLFADNSKIKGAGAASQAAVDARVAEDRSRMDRDQAALTEAREDLTRLTDRR
ncbi:MAG: hypothetical protein ACREFX_15625 [Opitutaceae bacterium]